MNSFALGVDLAALDADLDAQAAQLEAAARPAAQAGAEVLYRAVKRNVAALGRVTGKLDRAIYQAFADQESGPQRAAYRIGWNARTAPHGHLVEFGYIQKYAVYLGRDGRWHTNKKAPLAEPRQIPARSFVRAAASQIPDAQRAMEETYLEKSGL